MVQNNDFNNYFCKFNLTLATRIIAFIGLAIAVFLVTVLGNDRIVNNYGFSRKTALALGLDWQHFHSSASTREVEDPDGKMIVLIVFFYATTFLVINIFLLFAAILNNRFLAMPWLFCELLGCLSKLGALIYHFVTEPKIMTKLFITGSVVYIVIMMWCWLIVFFAQASWDKVDKSLDQSYVGPVCSAFLVDSPEPYVPNTKYAVI